MQVNDEDIQLVKGVKDSGEVSNVSRPCNRTESIEGGRNLTSGRVKKVTSTRREVVNAVQGDGQGKDNQFATGRDRACNQKKARTNWVQI